MEKLLREEWRELLNKEWDEEYMVNLRWKMVDEYNKYQIYPSPELIFNAYNLVPPDKVKVVMLGQDPYHNGHAHGLAFSSLSTNRPYSLRVIFREIGNNLGLSKMDDFNNVFPSNDLTCWAEQGVLLINPVLTVRAGKAGSHTNIGWEQFSSAVLKELVSRYEGLIFALWGNSAQLAFKRSVIGDMVLGKHHLLYAGHPASGAYGRDCFSGCDHFNSINSILKSMGKEPIKWSTKK